MATFLTVWQESRERAVHRKDWRDAEKTLNELQAQLRQERQDEVTDLLRQTVARLLPDADIEIASIEHPGGVLQSRPVTVGLFISGRDATLGMLSSGQRNALLLSPLLSLQSCGTFGCLVVDDPVHALDDLRVDLLSRELVRLSEHYQVLVFTHDARLQEHLRALQPELDTIHVERDPATMVVTCRNRSKPWDAFLQDAENLVQARREDGWIADAVVASVIAGLCRGALDGAIRQTLINRSVRWKLDWVEELRRVESKTTKARARHVLQLLPTHGSAPNVRRCLESNLDEWNTAAHGSAPETFNAVAHIRAARKAAQELDRLQ